LSKKLEDLTTAVFIDGRNLYSALKVLGGQNINYKLLREKFQKETQLVRMYYFTPVDESEEFQIVRPLLDWLDYNGYTVIAKPMKTYGEGEDRRVKGDTKLELAVTTSQLLRSGAVKQMVFFTGDGDYAVLLNDLKSMGVRVVVVSTIDTNPPFVADQLRRTADGFIELTELLKEIGMKEFPKVKTARRRLDNPKKDT